MKRCPIGTCRCLPLACAKVVSVMFEPRPIDYERCCSDRLNSPPKAHIRGFRGIDLEIRATGTLSDVLIRDRQLQQSSNHYCVVQCALAPGDCNHALRQSSGALAVQIGLFTVANDPAATAFGLTSITTQSGTA